MERAVEEYMRGINRTFRYIPNWTPGRKRQLGDVGYFDRGVFNRQTNLDDFGIPFDERADDSPVDYLTRSGRGVEVKFKAEGESAEGFQSLTRAEAGARIEFSRSNGYLFSAPKSLEHEIENKRRVKREVVHRLESGDADWEDNYTVIMDLVEAPSATILISGSSGAFTELRAKGQVGESWFTLAGISANAEYADSSGMSTTVVADETITPLFVPLKLDRSILDLIVRILTGRREIAVVEGGPTSVQQTLSTPAGEYELDPGISPEEFESELESVYESDTFADHLFEEVEIDEVLASS